MHVDLLVGAFFGRLVLTCSAVVVFVCTAVVGGGGDVVVSFFDY